MANRRAVYCYVKPPDSSEDRIAFDIMKSGLLIMLAALAMGIWYFRRNARTTPLARHYKDLEDRAAIGRVSNAAAFMAVPPTAMLGEGSLTQTVLNKNNPDNPAYNRVLPTRFGFRYPQPKG